VIPATAGTSSSKVYFTQYCFSSGGEARPKDHLQFEINPWQLFARAKIISYKAIYGQKLGQNTGEEKQNLLSKKEKTVNLIQSGKILH
jgi:hypothetical protein